MTSGENITEIVNLINLYPVAVDTQTWYLFDRVFTQDVRADFGGAAVWTDLAALKSAFAAIHAPFDATQHITTNHQVVVDGDRASCLSYVHGRFIRTVADGGNLFESTGWYDDRLVWNGCGWRICERVCRMQWWGGNPQVLATAPGVKVEQVLDSLKTEAAAGRIGHLGWLAKTAG